MSICLGRYRSYYYKAAVLTIAVRLVGSFDTRCPLELADFAVGSGHFFPELRANISLFD
jgi:hypothetical protein